MNPEVKKLWLDALRDGDYEQGTGQLKQNDKFCCLGVLCDLYKEHVGGTWYKGYFCSSNTLPEESSMNDSTLPSEVSAWAGISCNPDIHREGMVRVTAAECNDSMSESFAQIADRIEEVL